jgi:hypothetical protein
MKKTRFTEERMVTMLRKDDPRPVPEVAKKHNVRAHPRLRVAAGHEGPLPSIRRTSTANTRGPRVGAKCSARGGCCKTVTTYATCLSAGGVADEWVTQLLRQGDAKVFKKDSQMKLQMKREALQKLNRTANERCEGFGTSRVSFGTVFAQKAKPS